MLLDWPVTIVLLKKSLDLTDGDMQYYSGFARPSLSLAALCPGNVRELTVRGLWRFRDEAA